MSFVDFAELKARVQFSSLVQMLDLRMKKEGDKLRGPCPGCKKGGDRALVITEGRGWYCFGNNGGGDQIGLVAHINGCSMKEAAHLIARHMGLTGTSTSGTSPRQTVSESETGQEGNRTFQPLAYLEAAHPAVEAVGFDPEIAKGLGIGYAPKGILRGQVAVPIRSAAGELLGYIGITEAKLPPSFMGKNVVELNKRPA